MTARIDVRLTPRGGRAQLDGWDGAVLRARASAPPAEGRATAATVRLVAKARRVPPSCITLVAGAQSRTKVIEVDGLTRDEVRARI